MQGLLSTTGIEAKTIASNNGADSAEEDEKPVVDTDTKGTVPLLSSVGPLLICFTEPFFEIRPAQGKGLGLFAARSIPRGTRIIEEPPLLAMPRREGCVLTASDLKNGLRSLNHEQQGKLFELYRNRDALARRLSIEQPELLRDLRRENLVDAAAIFTANCVEMPELRTNRAGVFEHYSRINHACNPTCTTAIMRPWRSSRYTLSNKSTRVKRS